MAKAKKKSKPKAQSEQSERFKRAAIAVGADATGEEFERAFGKIVAKARNRRRNHDD